MQKIKEAAAEFLAHKSIAVTGVSRTPRSHGSNYVYQRLRDRGYQVYAVNPNADTVEGDPCYHDLKSIPGGVEAVVIGTRPDIAGDTMPECADGGCPLMFEPTADAGHKIMRPIFTMRGKVPRKV